MHIGIISYILELSYRLIISLFMIGRLRHRPLESLARLNFYCLFQINLGSTHAFVRIFFCFSTISCSIFFEIIRECVGILILIQILNNLMVLLMNIYILLQNFSKILIYLLHSFMSFVNFYSGICQTQFGKYIYPFLWDINT